MSNKLEKLFFSSKLPNLLFVQCTQMRGSVGGEGTANTAHTATLHQIRLLVFLL